MAKAASKEVEETPVSRFAPGILEWKGWRILTKSEWSEWDTKMWESAAQTLSDRFLGEPPSLIPHGIAQKGQSRLIFMRSFHSELCEDQDIWSAGEPFAEFAVYSTPFELSADGSVDYEVPWNLVNSFYEVIFHDDGAHQIFTRELPRQLRWVIKEIVRCAIEDEVGGWPELVAKECGSASGIVDPWVRRTFARLLARAL